MDMKIHEVCKLTEYYVHRLFIMTCTSDVISIEINDQ